MAQQPLIVDTADITAVGPEKSSAAIDRSKWEPRADGTKKGDGFLGVMQRLDGSDSVMSEFSIPLYEKGEDGHDKNGPEIPTFVPTLSKAELSFLLKSKDPDKEDHALWMRIAGKAVAYAKERERQGKPYFAQPGEQNTRLYPELKRAGVSEKPKPLVVSADDITPVAAPTSATAPARDPRITPMDATKKATVAPTPSPVFDVARQSLSLGGMAAGAAEGAELGAVAGPPGMFFGGLSGAIVGGIGGEGLELALEGLWQKLRPGSGLNLNAGGAKTRLADAGNAAMIGEAGGALTSAATRPFANKMEPFAKEALQTFKRPSGKGSAVSPGEITQSRILKFGQAWSEGSIFGGAGPQAERQGMAESKVLKVLDDLAPPSTALEAGQGVQAKLPADPSKPAQERLATLEQQRAANLPMRDRATDAVRKAGEARAQATAQKLPQATPAEAGQTVRAARAKALTEFRTQERTAWKAFEEQTQAIPVDTPRLDQFVDTLTSERRGQILPDAGKTAADKIGKLGTDVPPATDLRGSDIAIIGSRGASKPGLGLRRVLKELSGDGEPDKEPLTVAQFQKTVSDLGKLQRSLEQSARSDPSKYNSQLGLVKKLNALAHQDLEDVLGRVSSVEPDGSLTPGSPLALYKEATQFTRLGNETLFNEEVRKVVKQAPEKVAEALGRRNNSTAIRLTTQAVGDTAMQPVRRVVLDKMLAPDPVTKAVNWKGVVRDIDNMGPDTIAALFPHGEIKGIQSIADGVLEAERVADAQTAAELQSIGEARATVKAAQKADPLATFRKTSPEKIAAQLFNKNNVTAVRAIKGIVGDDGFKPIQRVAMESVLHPDPISKRIEWDDVVRRLDGIDPDTLQEFFPPAHVQEIKRVSNLMLKLGKRAEGLPMTVRLGQYGVIAGALSGTLPAKAGVVVLTPQLLSRIFASPTGLRWLSMGLEAKPWSVVATRSAAALTAFLYRESQEHKRDAASKKAASLPESQPTP